MLKKSDVAVNEEPELNLIKKKSFYLDIVQMAIGTFAQRYKVLLVKLIQASVAKKTDLRFSLLA